jgi:hypothetical protein
MEDAFTFSVTLPGWAIVVFAITVAVTVPLQLYTAVLSLRLARLKIDNPEIDI